MRTTTDTPTTATDINRINDLFERLRAAGCQLLTVNGYLHHEPVDHGEHLAYSHVHHAERAEDAELIELPVSYSDYGGSDIDAANVRALLAGYGDDTFVHLSGGHGSTGLALPYGRALPDDDDCDILPVLVDVIERLRDHPVIDEQAWSTYVDGLAEDAWDEWLRHDVISGLEALCPNGCDGCPVDDGLIRTTYYGFEANEWVCDTATTVVNLRHAEAVAHLARTLFEGNAS
ncbi:hypothetical protein NLX83_15685 [Allokutzneria sp. A3M-2-11 16]|uniref:hypothetical protein n=1 Tax=Allokutzneria sp. A3M-2-11 16 TaxID=2962043 RepID=UPI0020B8F0EC|nr:hypothetical protein [Allokutzneria sp. A3M-2-11 16]MCP3800709.1 hypothetical protein [Allokutzneria sp. A3M-2-11 16]